MKGDYEEFHALSRRKNKAKQSQFISVQCSAFGGQRQDEKKGDLKKQTQFATALIGATSFVKGDYDNKPACGDEKNKAKQSQYAGLWPEILSTKL